MKKLLITGFDPFHKNAENPSWLAAAALPDTVGEYELKKLQLPTVYGVAAGKVIAEAAADMLLPAPVQLGFHVYQLVTLKNL
jgi:pyrrolidone-carboxylate peptidase